MARLRDQAKRYRLELRELQATMERRAGSLLDQMTEALGIAVTELGLDPEGGDDPDGDLGAPRPDQASGREVPLAFSHVEPTPRPFATGGA